ncbi:hypothetical protein AtNW77_Chr4g0298391 [Arabidopsis thaliana]
MMVIGLLMAPKKPLASTNRWGVRMSMCVCEYIYTKAEGGVYIYLRMGKHTRYVAVQLFDTCSLIASRSN